MTSSVVYGLFNWTGIFFIALALEPASTATLKAGVRGRSQLLSRIL